MGKTAGKGMSQLFEPVGLHGSPVPTVSVGICEAAPASGLADISFFQISLSFVKGQRGFSLLLHTLHFLTPFLARPLTSLKLMGVLSLDFLDPAFSPTCASLSLGSEAVKGKAAQWPYCSETKWLKILTGL